VWHGGAGWLPMAAVRPNFFNPFAIIHISFFQILGAF
jgi:hypothetical protein